MHPYLTIEVWCRHGGDEELAAVSVWASVGHAQHPWARVLQAESLILELVPVDGVSTEPWPVPNGILCMVLGCLGVYGFLLGVGQLIYGHIESGSLFIVLAIVSSIGLFKIWK